MKSGKGVDFTLIVVKETTNKLTLHSIETCLFVKKKKKIHIHLLKKIIQNITKS